ncbi:MAG: hypothetical protein JF606_27985 [Burkholderiales bacterium]|nr:hypothetical protein [Burkholderiales bacterium]
MTQNPTTPLAADLSNASDARTRKSVLPTVFATVALLLIAVAGWLWFHKHQAASSPSPSPLEPTPATTSVLVPAEREPLLVPVPVPGPMSASSSLAKAAVATADSASTAVSAVVDTLATLRVGLNQLTSRVDTLEAHDHAHDDQITALRSEVDRLKADRLAVAASAPTAAASSAAAVSTGDDARTANARSTARPPRSAPGQVAHRRVAVTDRRATGAGTSSTALSAEGAVLAVDLWGGKPSVALARSGEGGTELRFFNEGETQGRVTVKRADVATQKATFATPAGEFTLVPKEQ